MDGGTGKKLQHLEFDTLTRADISKKFSAAFLKASPSCAAFFVEAPRLAAEGLEHQADAFISCLEGIAETSIYTSSRDDQKRRKERLEAIANTIDTLIGYVAAVDDPALGFAMWNGLREATKDSPICTNEDRECVDKLQGFPAIRAAFDLQHGDACKVVRDFAAGFRQAIKELPPLDKRKYEFIDQAASFIEDYLGRRNIPVSTSDTGLAGTALIATLELAGMPAPRAGYRMKLAKDSSESWQNFITKMKERHAADEATLR